MSTIQHYIHAATRANTRKAYQAAVHHFEVEWGGFLPATADSVARYLVGYAPTLSLNTLRLRLSGIAQWHRDQGFPDPTKAPVVKKVLRGIAELHPAPEKQARPLQLLQLQQVVQDIERQQRDGQIGSYDAEGLRLARDKSLILMGFWRAFRSDELVHLDVEHIQIVPGDGMELLVRKSKTDYSGKGRAYKAPALRQLCPVAAYQDWIDLAGLKAGPVYRSITRWGHLGENGLNASSVIPILRERLKQAGLAEAETFTSHSLRRGFASWANANRWGVKTLMEYVGWKNAETAMRYIDAPDPFEEIRAVQDSGATRWDATSLPSGETESSEE